MNKPHKEFSVVECKTQASILLKTLRSPDPLISQKSAKRFLRLEAFKHFNIQNLLQADIKLKHALAVIAIEKGFDTWTDLKSQLPLFRGGFLNHWFASYSEAKLYQAAQGGYLFPFKKQFFICDADYINNLGLHADDNDWELIGYDWAKPSNQLAWRRLNQKWLIIQEKQS